MSRRILSALLALVLVAGFAAVTKADVTGSFDIRITMNPVGNQTEAVKFEFDLQSNLIINVTLSGLTLGADLGFGVTGVEFAVLSLNTNLGALAVNDLFVFAEPFACSVFPGAGSCAGNTVVPIGGDATGVTRAVGFVKKRIELELNIAGITLNNLALFEDVDFPDINVTGNHEHDHFLTSASAQNNCGDAGAECSPIYFVGGVDNVVDNQTPTFGFGDVITISGQTVSGITVSGATAFCASGVNTIKKKSWTYEVNEACTSEFGNGSTALEGGAKTPLLFEEETLSVSGIEVGGVTLSISSTWVPLGPISSNITASFNVLDLADVTILLTSSNITNLTLSRITTSITSGNLGLTLVDLGGDLDIDQAVAVLSVTLNQNQNPASLSIVIVTIGGVGITDLSATLSISRDSLSLDSTTTFSGSGGALAWAETEFGVSVDGGGGISFDASFSYTPNGMGTTVIELGVVF